MIVAAQRLQSARRYWAFETSAGVLDVANKSSRVDRALKVIRGVKILGLESRNPARVLGLDERDFGEALDQPYGYTYEALQSAAHLYEDAKVYLDHTKFDYDDRTGRRVVQLNDTQRSDDLLGWLRNVRAVEGVGLVGDLHYLESHPFTPRLLELTDRNPRLIGLSHEALFGKPRLVNGRVYLTEISHLDRVALITDKPGTTSSLFETAHQPRRRMQRTMKTSLRLLFENAAPDCVHRDLLKQVIEQMDGEAYEGSMTADMPVDVPAESGPEDQILNGIMAAINKAMADAVAAGDVKTLKAALKAFGMSDSVTEIVAGGAKEGDATEGTGEVEPSGEGEAEPVDETPLEETPAEPPMEETEPGADEAPPEISSDAPADNDTADEPEDDEEGKAMEGAITFADLKALNCVLEECGAGHAKGDEVVLESMMRYAGKDAARQREFATRLTSTKTPTVQQRDTTSKKKQDGQVLEAAEKFKEKGSLASALRKPVHVLIG